MRPPYNEWSSCKKCGKAALGISVRYTVLAFGLGGVMRRECGRCGYVWDEAPLDEARARDRAVA